jgi:hypothetical protein
MFKKTIAWTLFILAVLPCLAFSSSYLLFLEAQGIAGYSTAVKKAIFFSMSQMEAMQKPSLGFDYVQRFSGASGDFAVLAVQARLAVNADGDKTLEPQLYNAYLKIKTRSVDIWIGHNRPKFGLVSSLDTHAQLLQPLSMNGLGFDRDWGVGVEGDYAEGNAGISLTTGSGMPLYFKGNFFLSGRYSRGILNQDNYNVGISVGYGRILDVAGYHLMSETPMEFAGAGLDFSWLKNNLEHRVEFMAGTLDDQGVFAIFWRTGIGLLEEGRLKLEAQPVIVFARKKTQTQLSVGASYLATPDWTLRAMVQYDRDMKDVRFVIQAYFYKGIRF